MNGMICGVWKISSMMFLDVDWLTQVSGLQRGMISFLYK